MYYLKICKYGKKIEKNKAAEWVDSFHCLVLQLNKSHYLLYDPTSINRHSLASDKRSLI